MTSTDEMLGVTALISADDCFTKSEYLKDSGNEAPPVVITQR
jgi:hypothetical protein